VQKLGINNVVAVVFFFFWISNVVAVVIIHIIHFLDLGSRTS
jgi:hypothetical protein